jgi:hypothetical protein
MKEAFWCFIGKHVEIKRNCRFFVVNCDFIDLILGTIVDKGCLPKISIDNFESCYGMSSW